MERVCPICQGTHWLPLAGTLSGAEPPDLVKLTSLDGVENALLAFACGGCGFVRLHSVEAFAAGG